MARPYGEFVTVRNANSHVTTLDNSAVGELLMKQRADGMITQYRYDQERQLAYSGDPQAGFGFTYDASFRLQDRSLRNGNNIGLLRL